MPTTPARPADTRDAAGSAPAAPTDPEAHRLHRDPESVDGLQPENADDHTETPEAEVRAEDGRKPYTTETESYGNPSLQPPDHPEQRAEATRPPRR